MMQRELESIKQKQKQKKGQQKPLTSVNISY